MASAVTAAALVGAGAPAQGATRSALPTSLTAFADCPVSSARVTLCLAGATGGTFSIGNVALTLPSPARLSLGVRFTRNDTPVAVLPTDGAAALVAPSANIPVLGGLVNVGATTMLGGLPTLSIANLLSAQGTALTLPVVVDLSNPLLGSRCTVGTTSAPLTLELTDGTTDPPPPNSPVTGNRGTLTTDGSGLITLTGTTLVDNAFAAPGASGCGAFGIEDPLVDVLEALPARAGTNAAALSGTVQTVPASVIRQYLG